MGKFHRDLTEQHIAFIHRQRIFFVATAPTDDGRINLSPKGYDCLAVIDPRTIAYVDYAGSGNETANHVAENGRLTFMWCSFGDKPLILRAYGDGVLLEKDTEAYSQTMARHFPAIDRRIARRVILMTVEAVQTSCGAGVPIYEFIGDRKDLHRWSQAQADNGTLDEYIRQNASRAEAKYPQNR